MSWHEGSVTQQKIAASRRSSQSGGIGPCQYFPGHAWLDEGVWGSNPVGPSGGWLIILPVGCNLPTSLIVCETTSVATLVPDTLCQEASSSHPIDPTIRQTGRCKLKRPRGGEGEQLKSLYVAKCHCGCASHEEVCRATSSKRPPLQMLLLLSNVCFIEKGKIVTFLTLDEVPPGMGWVRSDTTIARKSRLLSGGNHGRPDSKWVQHRRRSCSCSYVDLTKLCVTKLLSVDVNFLWCILRTYY